MLQRPLQDVRPALLCRCKGMPEAPFVVWRCILSTRFLQKPPDQVPLACVRGPRQACCNAGQMNLSSCNQVLQNLQEVMFKRIAVEHRT